MASSFETRGNSFESHSPELNDPLAYLLSQAELASPGGEDNLRHYSYYKTLEAPLIAGFDGWMQWINETQTPEIKTQLHSLTHQLENCRDYRGYLYFLNMFNPAKELGYRLTSPSIDVLELFDRTHQIIEASPHAFNAHLIMFNEAVLTPELLEVGFQQWLNFVINPEKWQETEDRIGVPFMLELPGKTVGMPETMILAGLQYELRFGKFYVPVPGIKHDPYAKNLFNYLGKNYEEVSDLEFKGEVFSHLLDFVGKLTPLRVDHKTRLLDVGCGTGLLGEQASPDRFELYGVDFAREMCRVTRERRHSDGTPIYTQVIEASAANMKEYDDNSFNAAVLSFVEIWLDSPGFEAVFQEIHRVLRLKGTVVFNIHKPYPGRKEQLADQLQQRGFSDIQFLEARVKTSNNGQGQLVTYCSARK